MKLTLNALDNHSRGADKHWPNYIFGGRVRTSTLVLIIAFCAAWWTYNTYKPQQPPPVAPTVVPPGFVPDPNYTWVPRTRVQQPRYDTPTPTPTTTVPTTPPTTSPTTTTPSPLIQLPQLPPPFGPATTPSPAPSGPTPAPAPAPGLPLLPGLPR